MVSVLAFYSNSLSSNPTDLSSFYSVKLFQKTKKHKERPFYEIIQFCIISTSTRFAISNSIPQKAVLHKISLIILFF